MMQAPLARRHPRTERFKSASRLTAPATVSAGVRIMYAHDRDAAPEGLNRSGQPPTVLLVVDDEADAVGPGGWAHLQSMMTWAAAGIVQASSVSEGPAEMAMDTTLSVGRMLVVETCFLRAADWLDALRPKPATLIVQQDGCWVPVFRHQGDRA